MKYLCFYLIASVGVANADSSNSDDDMRVGDGDEEGNSSGDEGQCMFCTSEVCLFVQFMRTTWFSSTCLSSQYLFGNDSDSVDDMRIGDGSDDEGNASGDEGEFIAT